MFFCLLLIICEGRAWAAIGENQGFLLKDGMQLLGEGAQVPDPPSSLLTKIWILDLREWPPGHRPPWLRAEGVPLGAERGMILWDGQCPRPCADWLKKFQPKGGRWLFFSPYGMRLPPLPSTFIRQTIPQGADAFAVAEGWFRSEEARKK
jgi:hypothetical protein